MELILLYHLGMDVLLGWVVKYGQCALFLTASFCFWLSLDQSNIFILYIYICQILLYIWKLLFNGILFVFVFYFFFYFFFLEHTHRTPTTSLLDDLKLTKKLNDNSIEYTLDLVCLCFDFPFIFSLDVYILTIIWALFFFFFFFFFFF